MFCSAFFPLFAFRIVYECVNLWTTTQQRFSLSFYFVICAVCWQWRTTFYFFIKPVSTSIYPSWFVRYRSCGIVRNTQRMQPEDGCQQTLFFFLVCSLDRTYLNNIFYGCGEWENKKMRVERNHRWCLDAVQRGTARCHGANIIGCTKRNKQKQKYKCVYNLHRATATGSAANEINFSMLQRLKQYSNRNDIARVRAHSLLHYCWIHWILFRYGIRIDRSLSEQNRVNAISERNIKMKIECGSHNANMT